MNAPREGVAARDTMESAFHELADAVERSLVPGETSLVWFSAETSDFVRMSRGRVRQPGTVVQRYLDVELIRGAKHASHRLSLSGAPAADRDRVRDAIGRLRAVLPDLDDDPHLVLATEAHSTRTVRGSALPPSASVIDEVLRSADGLDLVGLYAAGPVCAGFANSLGQRNWHEVTSFSLQWSLYDRADKAVKSALSGLAWEPAALAARMHSARTELAQVARPAKDLPPGKYRAYLTPAAMEEVVSLLGWDAFSARALETRQSSLSRMRDGDGEAACLDPRISMAEASAEGVAPCFQGQGFVRPDRVPLIERGRLVGSLVSPRTAREFSLRTNGASGHEGPVALAMAGGPLAAADALAALGTGLWVGNLHYLNYSDRPACRFTGMTRFATFWVEDGKVVAPINVLRFDDTIYRMLGASLEALTAETELMLASDTYRERSLASVRVPGALLSELTFTL
jgi:predicted Zn-dependent protease